MLLIAGVVATVQHDTTSSAGETGSRTSRGRETCQPGAAVTYANNCFACHGPYGVSPVSIPSLHALTAQNIADLLKAFKSGQRPSTVMGRHAKGYNNTEIEAISNYIASLNKK
jgi:sulfide dehydrogenase cytochrome subunit